MGRHGAVGEQPVPVERHDGPAPAPCSQVVASAAVSDAWVWALGVEFDGQDG